MQEASDEELVAISVAEGETGRGKQALDELFRRYQGRVAVWCWRVAGDRDWAADLAQEVFMRALRNISSFRGEAKFSTWLYTIARNHCFNAVRSRSTRAEEQMDFDSTPDSLSGQFGDKLEMEDEIRVMRELIDESLDETEKQVMTLHYGEEMTIDGITRLLDLRNPSGAKAHIDSAKRKLQSALVRWKARSVNRSGGRGAAGERV